MGVNIKPDDHHLQAQMEALLSTFVSFTIEPVDTDSVECPEIVYSSPTHRNYTRRAKKHSIQAGQTHGAACG